MTNKTISIFNGNNKRYTLGIPELMISKFGNETAKNHFIRNTGLKLVDKAGYYKAQPKTFKQLYKVFVTYNWKTTFYNNASHNNVIKLEHNI